MSLIPKKSATLAVHASELLSVHFKKLIGTLKIFFVVAETFLLHQGTIDRQKIKKLKNLKFSSDSLNCANWFLTLSSF